MDLAIIAFMYSSCLKKKSNVGTLWLMKAENRQFHLFFCLKIHWKKKSKTRKNVEKPDLYGGKETDISQHYKLARR